jgi:excisionase family DNA binding protein
MNDAEPDARRPDGDGPGYWTVEQTAGHLQVSSKTVFRLIARDKTFPAIKLGAVVRVNKARLRSWLAARERRR